MTTRRLIVLVVAVALGMSVAAVAQAHTAFSRVHAPVVKIAGHTDAVHAAPATWGLAARPDYSSIAFAPDGMLYAADPVNNRIYKVTSRGRAGHTTVVAGSGPGLDLKGSSYQHWKYIRNHGWSTVGAYGGDGQHGTDALFSAPFFLTFDAAGNMFVADHLNDRIREITTDGFVQTVAGTGNGGPRYGVWSPGVGPAAGDGGPATHSVLDAPWGVTLDAAGDLFIADRAHDAIRKVDTNGVITTVAGTGHPGFSGDGGAATHAQLNRPLTTALDGAGNLYIDDESNRRIRLVDRSGDITTFAGDGRFGCGGDGGQAIDASFKDPNEIGFAPDGSMLITDNECHDIRRIAPDGTISTFAKNSTDSCRGIVGRKVSHLPVGFFTFGPDGDFYLAACHRVLRVDDTGTAQLFARAPLFSHLS